ncbi:DUF4153 domain-containing protein [Aquimarina algicola]|uniref:DUF4153 domain-containing protein n=1 Tax=Aquimarina algicola TaxID=2589995 RepID=A0A504J9D2_9FLAO|nr:DUF4153 domain-containing protein [Aquimarina algicola]TPN85195.1 DUF4153 domain-containing protein [Aquimarina algicola]
MKLPSIDYLIKTSKDSFLRFPLTILSSLLSVIIGIYLIEVNEDKDNLLPFIHILLVTSIGIPLFFCASVFSEKQKYNTKLRVISQVVVLILLIALYFSFPSSKNTLVTTTPYIRYAIFNIVAHLLVSFIPYLKNKEQNGFWNYNKILFLRISSAVLYSGFLYIGLILALSALRLLFNISIHEELYFEIFIIIIGFFNTWFFVSGIPKNLEALEDEKDYPNGLRIFAQYVLLPLLILYLIILYAYGSKILINWDWPKGLVSYLISCVAILGILTLLLIHPYGNLKGNTWIKKFTSGYYFIIIPLIILFFIAIAFRIGDYGITINRYLLIFLGVWLSLISIYFIFGKANIKFIPISLATLLTLVLFGPWGMFSISQKSQINRLHHILETHSIIANNKINNEVFWNLDSLSYLHSEKSSTNDQLLKDSIHNEVKSIVDYLDDYHGFSGIDHLFTQNMDSLIKVSMVKNSSTDDARIYMETMGLEYRQKYNSQTNRSNYFTYSSKHYSNENNFVRISNYDYLINFSDYYITQKKEFNIDNKLYTLSFKDSKQHNEIIFYSESDTISFALNTLATQLSKEYGTKYKNNIDSDKLSTTKKLKGLEVKLMLNTINLQEVKNKIQVRAANGFILIKSK